MVVTGIKHVHTTKTIKSNFLNAAMEKTTAIEITIICNNDQPAHVAVEVLLDDGYATIRIYDDNKNHLVTIDKESKKALMINSALVFNSDDSEINYILKTLRKVGYNIC